MKKYNSSSSSRRGRNYGTPVASKVVLLQSDNNRSEHKVYNDSSSHEAVMSPTSASLLEEHDEEEILQRNVVKARIQYFNHQIKKQKSNTKSPHNGQQRIHCPMVAQDDKSSITSSPYTSSYSRQVTELGSDDEEEERLSTISNTSSSSKKAANIAKEILSSEEVYVRKLKLLNEDFRSFVSTEEDVIPESDLKSILSYIPELLLLNEDLLCDFVDRVKTWDSNPRISDIMVNKGKFLLIYASYIKEFPRSSKLYGESLKKYPKFKERVASFQLREECKNLKIEHLMLEPIQRLPRYKLLFERYFKNITEDSLDYESSLRAMEIIRDIADQANRDLKENDAFKKMLNLQSRVNESDLIQPDRELLKEGELLKISRNSVDPRYIVLLSDILLYTTSYSILSGDPSNNNLRIHYKIPLMKLKVGNMEDEIDAEETDFQIISSVRSCVLRANTLEEKLTWIRAINEAAETFRNKRSTFDIQKSKDVEEEAPEIILGETAPVWIPDKKVSMCQKCAVEFSVLTRRHHCRGCGIVTCFYCSDNRAPLKYLKYKADRVCDSCYDLIIEEYYFQDAKHNGQYLSLFRKRGEPKAFRSVPERLKLKANTEGAQASGYLKKRVVKSGKWKKSWFVLKDNVLYAYKASSDTIASDTFPVLGFEVEIISEKIEDLNNDPNGAFQLIHAGLQKYSLCFKAENEQQLQKWVKALKEASTF